MATEVWPVYVAAIVGIGNICILITLFYIYWQNYKEAKSKFTSGLLFFVSVLLLQNIFITWNIVFHGGFRHEDAVYPMGLYNIMLFIALSVLLKVTW